MGLRLVLDPDLSDTTGRFFTSTPGLRFLPPVSARRSISLQQRVWDKSAALVGLT
jgi:retinol dehydrogenase-12